MQANLVNFLNGAAPGGNGNGAASEKGGSDLFSQMLGDAGAQGGKGQNATLLKSADIAASALIAQEMNPDQLAALQSVSAQQLADLLGREIGPVDAKALLAQLQAGGEGMQQDPAFEQLQSALEQIEATGEPTDVASLLESLPVADEATTPAERAPLMQRMLQWMHGALDRQKEVSQQAALAQGAQDGTALSLQASLFPAGHDAAQAEAQKATDEAAEKTKTVTTVVPLVQQQFVAMPEWVRKLGEDQPDADLDAAIAPLALAPEAEELPEVTLPGAKDNLAKLPEVAAKPMPQFAEHLKPLSATMDDAQAAIAPVTQLEANNLHGSVPHTGTVHGTTTGTHGTGSTSMTPYTTHVPIPEQVHVAITQATQDGIDHITLQLDPADLGRVEVKMDIGLDGKTNLSFMVDKADTLDQLSRDARGLERMLQEAGVKADAGSMQFNLRQQPQPEFGEQGDGTGRQAANDNDTEVGPLAAADGVTTHYTLNVRDGVDIRA